jgi:flagellar protein FliJ
MNRYQFRLKALHKLRIAMRDSRRSELAEAFRAADLLSDEQTALESELLRLRELQRAAAEGDYFNINLVVDAQRYELVLKARAQGLAKQAALVAAEIERRRQLLVEADREVRVLELLDERQQSEHEQKRQRQESKQLDEIGVTRWRGL